MAEILREVPEPEGSRRGGYWFGPAAEPTRVTARAAVIDIERELEASSSVDLLGLVLAGLEPFLRDVARGESIADVVAAAAKHSGEPTGLSLYPRSVLAQILDYMDGLEEVRMVIDE